MPPSPTSSQEPPSVKSSQERAAPSLLPAFEPRSFSPALPRLQKWPKQHASPTNHAGRDAGDKQRYPTPLPSSSTLVPTSPIQQQPQQHQQQRQQQSQERRRRPPLSRTCSVLSERAPLSTLPSIEVPEDGEPVLMGRSSNSSHYQLSTNKLISRVHVRASYIVPQASGALRKIQIECTGWNGVKVHCQNRAWELMKGDTFTSETEGADIMLDVHDARVLLTWPRTAGHPKALTPTDSDRSSWDGDNSPTARRVTLGSGRAGNSHPNSPLRREHRLHSPVSPSPVAQAIQGGAAAQGIGAVPAPGPPPVQIYEDEPEEEEKEKESVPTQQTQISTQIASQTLAKEKALQESFISQQQEFSDNDEENDPIITSFGPFGADLDARLGNISTSTFSPPLVALSPHSRRRALEELNEESISPQRQSGLERSPKRRRLDMSREIFATDPLGDKGHTDALKNHVINQLAYSALSATPLSTLFESVPSLLRSHLLENTEPKFTSKPDSPSTSPKADDSGKDSLAHSVGLSHSSLEQLLLSVACVGAVQRSGKDAAGKRLESEFYYILEQDDDEKRREVVMGMGGRGLRNCRKSHKQYFWRKPK